MKVMSIDYGRKKVGLAIANTSIAEVYGVIINKNISATISKIIKIIVREKVETLVIGISEGNMANETIEFSNKLKKKLNIPIDFQDETLSTFMAEKLSIEAGIKKKKRKYLRDAYSAVVILQEYLDKKRYE